MRCSSPSRSRFLLERTRRRSSFIPSFSSFALPVVIRRTSQTRDSSLPAGGRALSPEARLVLCSAGGPETDDAIATLLPRVTDWPRLIALSVNEGAQPALGKRLRAMAARIPQEVRPAFEYVERAASFRQQYLHARMLDALRVLSGAEIPVVLLKGAALVQTTYESVLDRPMSDVDLLVRPDQADAAQSLLRRAGWEQRYDPKFNDFYGTMHHLPPLVDSRARTLTVGLELHTSIVQRDRDPFAFETDRIWERALPADGLPAGTLVPSLHHRLFHCCVHFAWSHKLGKGAWRSCRDVSAMVRNESVDWDRFIALARETRATVPCYWTLSLASSLASAPIPASVLSALRPRRLGPFHDMLQRHFTNTITAAERACPSDRLMSAIWTLAFRPERDAEGREPAWKGEDRAWQLMRGENDPAKSDAPRRARSAGAWLRYLGAVAS